MPLILSEIDTILALASDKKSQIEANISGKQDVIDGLQVKRKKIIVIIDNLNRIKQEVAEFDANEGELS